MKDKIKKHGIEIIIWILIILLFSLCISLVREYKEVVPKATPMSLRTFLDLKRNHGPLPAASADLIRPWMTFDYINTLFNLPSDYLQKTLSISDTAYPKLSISSYIKSINANKNDVLISVENAVKNYSLAQ